jgi:hypothetical protein
MDWIYLKCLRNATLQKMDNAYRTFCMIYELATYPVRPTGEHLFEVIGGFHQHPNSSSSM